MLTIGAVSAPLLRHHRLNSNHKVDYAVFGCVYRFRLEIFMIIIHFPPKDRPEFSGSMQRQHSPAFPAIQVTLRTAPLSGRKIDRT